MFSTVVEPGVFNFLSWIMDGIAVLPDYARNKIAFARGIHTGIYQTVSYFYCLSSFSRLFCSEMDVKMYEGRQLCGKTATHETLILRVLWCSISPATISYSDFGDAEPSCRQAMAAVHARALAIWCSMGTTRVVGSLRAFVSDLP